MGNRKHDDAHRPMGGQGQRGNHVATVGNCGGVLLVNVLPRARLCDPECAEQSLGGLRCTKNCVALEIPPMDSGSQEKRNG